MTEDYDVDATMRLMSKEIEELKKKIPAEIPSAPIPIEASLTDEQIIARVEVHIKQHMNKLQAPFSINGMARLLELAKKGLEAKTKDTDIYKEQAETRMTNCTGCCYTNGYCNCKGDN